MAVKKVTVVIAQSPGKNPVKRNVEETIAATLLLDPQVDVSLVPHLYDLTPDHTGMLFLKSVRGDMIILSWLFPRAARWILDRNAVKGHEGVSLLKSAGGDDDEDEDAPTTDQESLPERPNAVGAWDLPNRKIYCLDLRDQADPQVYLDEIRRITNESSVQTVDLMGWINGSPAPEQLQRYLNPVGLAPESKGASASAPAALNGNGAGNGIDEATRRRWYPVIDYSRCTNCMECIDFCLFGVYGVDSVDRILVEQQDNCKKGCPACSRVCPENAIIFPEHKTPAIAGSEVGSVSGLKIDLSKLFGAPSALEQAVLERDTELVADGRDAVGMSVGIPKRRSNAAQTHDALDDLMDGLDKLDL
jgi:Pyruvate/2-oxoacid:ferredoxin oxidoreductase delta subunit